MGFMGFFNKPKIIKFRGVVNRIGVYYTRDFTNFYACKLKGLDHDIIKFKATDDEMFVNLSLTKENDDIEFVLIEKNPKNTLELIEFKNLSL